MLATANCIDPINIITTGRTLTPTTPTEVVRQFNKAWAEGDLTAAMLWIARDCVYTLYISGELLPFGGETAGRANIEAVLRQVRLDFEYLLYRPLNLKANGEIVRFQVEFMYRHRRSGETLSGRFRLVMRVHDGLIVSADEYHDRAKVEAFMRLFGSPT